MIGKLRGRVDHIGTDGAVIDVGGVGYEVFCSARTIAALPAVGGQIELVIETLCLFTIRRIWMQRIK